MNLTSLVSAPWAIQPAAYRVVCEVAERHMRGEAMNRDAIEAAVGRPLGNNRRKVFTQDGVAIIDIQGVMAKRMNLMLDISGGTSTEIARQEVESAVANPDIRAIVLAIESPGGAVDGTQELADAVYAARSHKPVEAVVSGIMASAATWVGTAASKVWITSDTAVTGNIGVVATHREISGAERAQGVKTTEIVAGRFKRAASIYQPLSAEGRDVLQEQVDAIYSVFVDAVARNRGTTAERVIERMADGRDFIGRAAIAVGLVDGVASLESVVSRLAAGSAGRTRSLAQAVDAPAAQRIRMAQEDAPVTPSMMVKRHNSAPPMDVLDTCINRDDALRMLEASGNGIGVDWSVLTKRRITEADLNGQCHVDEYMNARRTGK